MDAKHELQRAFRERADGIATSGAPLVGLFGDGIPAPLLHAAGGFCADIKAPPLADATDGPKIDLVDEIAESFLDEFTTRFLHRFAAGAFDHFAIIIFARDDVAGLAAYQYASELRRQNMVSRKGPVLHLWNLAHTDKDAARTYNLTELTRLIGVLAEQGLVVDDNELKAALSVEKERRKAVDQIACNGANRFVYRAAGRWLSPNAHLAALSALPAEKPVSAETRIGLVGTACDDISLREICSEIGTLQADLMPFGDVWGYDISTATDAETLIHAIATDPLNIRANPAGNFGAALQSRLENCDLVVSAVDHNDDSFGWEVPRIRDQAHAKGARFIDLGFVPFRPSNAWISQTKQRVLESLQ